MIPKFKTKDEAKFWALTSAKELVQDYDRMQSIIDLMNDAVRLKVTEANAGECLVESWVPEAFAANTLWLLERIEFKVQDLWKNLEAAGLEIGHRV